MKREEWVTLKDAAAATGLSVHTMRAWTRDGKVEFDRIGQNIIINRGSLMKHFKDHKAEIEARSAGYKNR